MICKPEVSRKNSVLDKIRIYFPGRIRLIKEDSTLMRYLLLRSLAALTCFGVFSLPQTSAAPKPDQSDKPDFNGTWAARASCRSFTTFRTPSFTILPSRSIAFLAGAGNLLRSYLVRIRLSNPRHPPTFHVWPNAAPTRINCMVTTPVAAARNMRLVLR